MCITEEFWWCSSAQAVTGNHVEECLLGANSVHGYCCRMVHTTEEVSAAALANKDRLKIQKTARDFVMRVTSISGISSAACVPDGALFSTSLPCVVCLLSVHRALDCSTPCRDPCCTPYLLTVRNTRGRQHPRMTGPKTARACWGQPQGRQSALPERLTGTAGANALAGSFSCCAGLWELLQGKRGDQIQPTPEDAKQETEMVLFDVVENLLQKTSTSPSEVRAPRHACHTR